MHDASNSGLMSRTKSTDSVVGAGNSAESTAAAAAKGNVVISVTTTTATAGKTIRAKAPFLRASASIISMLLRFISAQSAQLVGEYGFLRGLGQESKRFFAPREYPCSCVVFAIADIRVRTHFSSAYRRIQAQHAPSRVEGVRPSAPPHASVLLATGIFWLTL